MAATSTAANITTREGCNDRWTAKGQMDKQWINIWMEGQIDGWSDNSERN